MFPTATPCQPTVALPTDAEAGDGAAEDEEDLDEDAQATSAVEALEKFACSACHDLEGSEGEVGPRLEGIATRMSRGDILEAIINPNAVIAEGFEPDMMPDDFGDWMMVSELTLIADYLVALE